MQGKKPLKTFPGFDQIDQPGGPTFQDAMTWLQTGQLPIGGPGGPPLVIGSQPPSGQVSIERPPDSPQQIGQQQPSTPYPQVKYEQNLDRLGPELERLGFHPGNVQQIVSQFRGSPEYEQLMVENKGSTSRVVRALVELAKSRFNMGASQTRQTV
jgi:hypothetical protein